MKAVQSTVWLADLRDKNTHTYYYNITVLAYQR